MLRKGRHKGLFDRLVTEFCSEDLVGLGLLTGVDRRVGAPEPANAFKLSNAFKLANAFKLTRFNGGTCISSSFTQRPQTE